MTLHHLFEFLKVFWKFLRSNGSIFYNPNRFTIPFNTGQHPQPRLAQSPYTSNIFIIDSAAMVGQPTLDKFFLQSRGLLFHRFTIEFGDEQGFWIPLDKKTIALLRVVGTTEFQYLAIHKLNGCRMML